MKTILTLIKSKSTAELRDAFIVIAFISSLVLLAQIGYWAGIIKTYSWQ